MAEISTIYASVIKTDNTKRVDLNVHFLKDEKDNFVLDSSEIGQILKGNNIVCSLVVNRFQDYTDSQLLKIDLKGNKIEFPENDNFLPKIIHAEPEICNNVVQIIEVNSTSIDEYIDLQSPIIKSLLTQYGFLNDDKIFILNDDSLYGPFKLNKSILEAVKGKSVYKYPYFKKFKFDLNTKTSVYIGELNEILKEVDCMSSDQLVEHCKSIMDVNVKNREIINNFKKIAGKFIEDGSELHKVRIKRIKNLVNQINFTQSEIEDIAQQKSVWNEIFSEMYHQNKELFLNEFREQLNTEIASIEEQKHTTEEALNVANIKLLDIQQLIKENENNLDRIKEKEQELIDNIKIQANIVGSSSYQKSNTFFERIESSKPIAKNAIELIESNDLTLEEIEQQLFHELIPKEVYYTNNINATLNILMMLNDYCYYLVNVEIDWIKYESLFENGLKQIVNEACNNNERMHFLILNDFNIANIEFYGKSLIDVINKTRSYIPGTNQPLPDNLKFILVETSCENEEENFPTRCQSINSKSVELDEILIIKDLNRLSKELKGEVLFNWNDFK